MNRLISHFQMISAGPESETSKHRPRLTLRKLLAFVLTLAYLFTSLPVESVVAAGSETSSPAVVSPKPLPPKPTQPRPDEPESPDDPKEDGDIRIMWFDVAMDIAGLAMSIAEYNANPTFWNAIGVIFDSTAVIVPGLPSVGAIKGGARAAMAYIRRSAKLKTALEAGGVQKYWKLLLRRMPKNWVRHHIIEKRFARRLGTTSLTMPAIPIDGKYHQLITNKMRAKIPYGTDPWKMTVRDILDKHAEAYGELFRESGDVYWEYLKDYVLEVKSRVPSHIK